MTGSYIGAALIVAGFAWLLLRLRLIELTHEIRKRAQQSVATMVDPTLKESDKERAMRKDSLALFRLFAVLTGGLAISLGLPILLVWLIGFTHLLNFDGVMAASLSWPFLLAGVISFCAVMLIGKQRRAG